MKVDSNEVSLDEDLPVVGESKEPTPEEIARDKEAVKMAKQLGDSEPDFNPDSALGEMDAETLKGTAEMLGDIAKDKEGAEYLAVQFLEQYETIMQVVVHEDFQVNKTQKDKGAKVLPPVIQKYAPQLLKLLGGYGNEIMAFIWLVGLTKSSVKQVKELKAFEAANEVKPDQEPEEQEEKQNEAA